MRPQSTSPASCGMTMLYRFQSRSLVSLGRCTTLSRFLGGHRSWPPYMGTTCERFLGPTAFQYSPAWCNNNPTGIRQYGVPIHLSGGPSDGSRQTGTLNHRLECTETCARRLFNLLGTADGSCSATFSGGERSCIGWRFTFVISCPFLGEKLTPCGLVTLAGSSGCTRSWSRSSGSSNSRSRAMVRRSRGGG
jgi:hypothetical protein